MTTIVAPTEDSSAPWIRGIEGTAAHHLIESDAKVIRVLAGPGAGKTTCLKRRIQRLIQNNGINPETIFVGTFTRAIAKELKEAVGKEVKVSTLHSHATELLRKFPLACQGMSLRFLLQYEQDAMLYDLEEVASTIGDIYRRREALRLLQASRSQRTVYANAAFAGAVRQWLQRHHGMLVGEVVYLCVTGLESQDIPPGQFDHVVIDEYQDLTAAEQELVRMIWSESGTLTVMGDDDQSIYRFRFNHPEGIADFNTHWPQCTDLTFTDNRRCGERILTTANLMMAEAGSNKPPMNWKSGRTGEVKAVQWESLDDEISGLATHIRSNSEDSFLVLVPRRFIGYRLAEAIGNDARTAFSEQILEHPTAQAAFATASLLADPGDFVAARAYLGLHGTKQERAQRRNADAYVSLPNNIGGHVLIRRLANGQVDVSGIGQSNIKARAKTAIELIDRSLTPAEIIDLVFDETLAKEEQDDEKRRWLTEDLHELHSAAHELLSRQDAPSLSQVMTMLRYRIATRAPLKVSDDEEPRVRIMTLHSAKGLEADNVIVAGVADQFMPGIETDAQVIAEQKRLLYVAVTRAKDSLILSWHRRIRTADLMKNMGRRDQVITKNGATWGITSRSSSLPQGLSGVISGSQLLASVPPEKGMV